MKILLAITKLSLGGSGRFIVQLAKGLKNNNYDITVLYGSEEANPHLEKELIKEGIQLLKVDSLCRDVNIQKDILSLVNTIFLLNKMEFDVIHTHTTKAGVIIRLAGYITKHKRIIHNPHGHIYDKEANLPGVNSYFKRIVFFLIEKIVNVITKSKIVAVSDKEYKEILNMGYSSKNATSLITHGIIVEERKIQPYNNNSIKNVLVMGRLSPEKGQDIAIETLKIIKENYKNFKLTILGDGNFKSHLLKLTAKYNLQNCVEFIPAHNNVSKFYEDAFCILIPSRYEGFSITALEAFQFKRPVILTENCGIAKHLQNGIDALISKVDPTELADNIIKIANDSLLYKNLVKNAYETLLTKFSFNTTLKKYIQLYSA